MRCYKSAAEQWLQLFSFLLSPAGLSGLLMQRQSSSHNNYHVTERTSVQHPQTSFDQRFSMLGWSDGGITALCAAIQQPKAIEKVLWSAPVSQVQLNTCRLLCGAAMLILCRKTLIWSSRFSMLNSIFFLSCLVSSFFIWYKTFSYCHHCRAQVEDVSNWSARMREPMEAVYGVEGFPKLWFEPRSKNILVVGQSNSMLQVSLVPSLH